MAQHIHELLHVSAATLFVVAAVSALREYRHLRERVVLSYGAMCLCSAAYATHVAISHSLPPTGSFWIPWAVSGVVVTFGATLCYLVTLQRFLGIESRLLLVPVVLQSGVTLVAVVDLAAQVAFGRSFLLVAVPRPGLSEHQRALGEGAYSLLPMAEVLSALFASSFVFGVVYFLLHLIRRRSRDTLLYAGLVVNAAIVVNDALLALSVYTGFYLIAFSKAFEAIRIHRDIQVRARERIEQRLRQAEKMEAIGRVTGGIAHDFKNVLTAVGGSIELAAEAIPQHHAAAEDLETARQGLQTGERLVRQLLDVARSRETEPEYVDINEFLADNAGFLSTVLLRATRLELSVEPEIGRVLIAPGQLTQVLMNLIVNAGEATPSGGTVEVRARVAWGQEQEVVGARSRPEVVISVIDHGRGIPGEVVEHIFEPFFTTKDREGGTGLGLATLYAIVQRAGGRVEVESALGRGTQFHVLLPRCER